MKKLLLLPALMLLAVSGAAVAQPPFADDAEIMEFLPESDESPLFAQGNPEDDTMFPPDRPPFHGEFGKRREQFEQFRMLKLLEVLDLDEKQEGPFMTSFTRFRSQMKELAEQRQEALRTLSSRTEGKEVRQNEVTDITNTLLRLDTERHNLFRQFTADMQKVLRPEQQAKLILFHERFEQEVREHLQNMRQGRREGRSGDEKKQGR